MKLTSATDGFKDLVTQHILTTGSKGVVQKYLVDDNSKDTNIDRLLRLFLENNLHGNAEEFLRFAMRHLSGTNIQRVRKIMSRSFS